VVSVTLDVSSYGKGKGKMDDYLDGKFWGRPAKTKVAHPPKPNAIEYRKHPDVPARFCECGKQISRYNKKAKCHACQYKD